MSVSDPAVGPALQTGSKPSCASRVMPVTTAGIVTWSLEYPKVHLRIESGADADLVPLVLETLVRRIGM